MGVLNLVASLEASNPIHLSAPSEAKIAEKLETRMTADGDRVGGPVVEVVRSTSQLNAEDRAAMAAYIKSLPAL